MIPFNIPYLTGKESDFIKDSLENHHYCGDGLYTKKCHDFFETQMPNSKALLTTSCTSALEMAAMLCDVKEGDEVIMPSYTFVSTANAFYRLGAKPIFCDIRPDTLNIDETKIEALITPRTKAIVPVHYAGISCEMDAINAIAKKHNLFVVEDAAQGVNSKYKDQYLGSIGDFGTYSFHETKNYICGEGGLLLVNHPDFFERAEIIREKGTNRKKFLRGFTDKYTWVDVGSSFLPSDLLAAFLYAQLLEMDGIAAKRKAVFDLYHESFLPLQEKGILKIPFVPKDATPNQHMFYLILENNTKRDALIAHLKENEIIAPFHYIPLHTSPMGAKFSKEIQSLPITETLSERLIRLPLYPGLTRENQMKVIKAINSFFA